MQQGRRRTPMPIREREALAKGPGPVITYIMSPEELEEYRATGKLIKEEEKMKQLTKEKYLQLRLEGKGRTEIMRMYFKGAKAFYEQLEAWGIKERDAEERALELMPKSEPEVVEGKLAIILDEPETKPNEKPASLAEQIEQLILQHRLEHNTTAKIKQWAIDRNLHTADPAKQILKLGEEYGELCQGLAKGNSDQVIDSIGDMYVVLVVLSMQLGIDIESCIDQAYDEIKDRKGKMINGVFVKEEDITA